VMSERLEKLFCPDSVAVVGASNGFDKLGYHVMKSLIQGKYGGEIFPVNPKGEIVWGLHSYPSLRDIRGTIDLAVIVVPASLVPQVLHECGQKMVKGVVLITAGFREIEDQKGGVLETEIRNIADQYALPILGPNTFGFVNPTFEINASFTSELSLLEKGGVALVSQSGGIAHLCGFLATEQRIGFSKLIGLGNRCNVDFAEVLGYLVERDKATKVIALYLEGLDRPREMVEAAKSLRGTKPIIAYKAGKGEKSDSASRFHTGSLAGNYRIWRGAFRQAGILEVSSIEELLDTAKVLDSCPPPGGPRIAVLSSQAGPGMVASDAIEKSGLKLSHFTARTQDRINSLLPPIAMRTNPVDMGPAWYSPQDILDLFEAVLEDEGTDGIIFMAMYASANENLANEIAQYVKRVDFLGKPVVACLSAPREIWNDAITGIDKRKGFAVLPTPERSVVAMGNLWRVKLIVDNGG